MKNDALSEMDVPEMKVYRTEMWVAIQRADTLLFTLWRLEDDLTALHRLAPKLFEETPFHLPKMNVQEAIGEVSAKFEELEERHNEVDELIREIEADR